MACVVLFCCGPGQTYGISAYVDPMIDETGISRSLYAVAFSIGTLLSAAAVVAIGRQIDRFGERAVMLAAIALFVVGAAVMSVASGPVGICAGFALLRVTGGGVLPLAARTLIPRWYVARRGWAFSMLGLAGAVSLAVVPLLHTWLVQTLGWRIAWRIDLAVLLALLPGVALLVRNRPEEMGLRPFGQPEVDPATAGDPDRVEGLSVREAVRTPAFWALAVASMVPTVIVTGLSFNQVAIIGEMGLPATLAASMYAVESAVQLAVTLLAGWLVDRSPARFSIAAGQASLVAAMVVLLLAGGPATAFLYAGLRGACAGFWMVAVDVAWPDYFGRRHLGSIRGVGFAFGVLGAALGPLPFGLIADATGSYAPAILALLALPVVATAAVLLAPVPGAVRPRLVARPG
jgi:MFS family permease